MTARGFLLLALDSNRVLVSTVSTPCKSMQTVALRFSPRVGTTTSTFRSSLFEERAAVGSGVSFPLCVEPQSASEVYCVACMTLSSAKLSRTHGQLCACRSFSSCTSTPNIQPYASWDMIKLSWFGDPQSEGELCVSKTRGRGRVRATADCQFYQLGS